GIFPITEQIPLQESQRRIIKKTAYRLAIQIHRRQDFCLCLPGQFCKPGNHVFAEGKKLIGVTVGERILPLIHSHRNTKLPQYFRSSSKSRFCTGVKPVKPSSTTVLFFSISDLSTSRLRTSRSSSLVI